MILILIPFIFLAKNSWNEKLKNQVEIVLENSRNEEYSKSFKGKGYSYRSQQPGVYR